MDRDGSLERALFELCRERWVDLAFAQWDVLDVPPGRLPLPHKVFYKNGSQAGSLGIYQSYFDKSDAGQLFSSPEVSASAGDTIRCTTVAKEDLNLEAGRTLTVVNSELRSMASASADTSCEACVGGTNWNNTNDNKK